MASFEVLKEGLDRYVTKHIPTGSFLRAVLENDLMETFSRADDTSLVHLKKVLEYMYWEIPSECYGTKERVQKWLHQDQTKE